MNAQKNTIQAYGISDMKTVIEHLSNNQDMVYMGIVGADVTTSISKSENIPIGVYVAEVSMNSAGHCGRHSAGRYYYRNEWSECDQHERHHVCSAYLCQRTEGTGGAAAIFHEWLSGVGDHCGIKNFRIISNREKNENEIY